MKKFFKVVGITFVVLIVLIGVGLFVLSRVVDVNSFKPQIASIVKSQTGRDLEIGGEIKLKIFPRLSIELYDISLSNAQGFEPPQMTKIGHVSTGVAIWPLLKKQIQISRVIVEELYFFYTINANGVSNIDDIIAHQAALAEAKEKEPAAEETEKSPSAPLFDINNANVSKFRIADSSISFTDQRTGVEYTLSDINMTANDVGLGKPVSFELSAALQEKKSKMDANVDIKATADLESDKLTAQIHKLLLKYQMPSMGLDTTIEMDANIVMLMDNKTLDVDKANITATVDLKSGDMTVNANIKAATAVKADLDKLIFDIPSLTANGDYTTSLMEGKQSVALTAAANYNVPQESFSLKNLNLKTAGLTLDANASGTKVVSAPNITGSFTVAEFSLRDLLKTLKIDYTPKDENAMTKVKASSTNFTFNNNVAKLPLKLNLDGSNIDADINANLANKKPSILLVMSADTINADKYMPAANPAPETDNASAKAAEPVKLEYPAIDLDLSTLPDLNATIKLNKLTLMETDLNNVNMTASVVNGVLATNLSVGNVYSGRLNADARVTALKDKFEAAANLNLTSVDLHSMLKVYAPDLDYDIVPKKGIVDLGVSMANKVINLTRMSITADSHTITGTAKMDFNTPRVPTLTFKMDANDFNLDAFIPKSKKGEDSTPKTVEPGLPETAGNTPIDLNALPFNADGDISVKSFSVQRFKATNLIAKIKLNDGTAEIAPFSANAWGGTLLANGKVTSNNGRMPADLKVNIANVKMQDAIGTFIAPDKIKRRLLSGDVSANLDVSVGGLTVSEMRSSLNGRATYTIKNGVVHGIGYNPNLISLDTLKTFTLLSTEKNTPLKDVSGSVTFTNGRLDFSQTKVDSQYMTGVVKGGIMLSDLSMDFGGTLNVESIETPFTLKGPLVDPKFAIDQDKLISALIIQFGKKTATGAITAPVKVPLDILEGVGKGLDKLFK